MSLPCLACGGTRVLTGDDWGLHGGEGTVECDECDGAGVQPCQECALHGRHTNAVAVTDCSHDGGPTVWAVCLPCRERLYRLDEAVT